MAEEDSADPRQKPRPAAADDSTPAPAVDWDALGRDLIERYAGLLAPLSD